MFGHLLPGAKCAEKGDNEAVGHFSEIQLAEPEGLAGEPELAADDFTVSHFP